MPDGEVFYTECSNDKGILYVNQLQAFSDDPQTAERIKQLNQEIEALFHKKR
ncbi:MAG: hypothetical protein GX617_07240 [Lentisphaerae bacterium]|nr:hypothetical protein [Lentisphaerota bacterium]